MNNTFLLFYSPSLGAMQVHVWILIYQNWSTIVTTKGNRECKRLKCTWSNSILRIPFTLLAKYMQHMWNNNLEIRIAGSSCRPQLLMYLIKNYITLQTVNSAYKLPLPTYQKISPLNYIRPIYLSTTTKNTSHDN